MKQPTLSLVVFGSSRKSTIGNALSPHKSTMPGNVKVRCAERSARKIRETILGLKVKGSVAAGIWMELSLVKMEKHMIPSMMASAQISPTTRVGVRMKTTL